LCKPIMRPVLGITAVLISCLPCIAFDEQLGLKELIDRATRAQVAAQGEGARFQYLRKEHEKEDARTYRVVESDAGSVKRMVAINDKDLTSEQRAHEGRWLDKLLANPSILKEQQKKDAEEEARRQKIITVLGRAFLYEIEGIEDGGNTVRLHFRPNPTFRADSRAAKVCAGLEGTMWIDRGKQRFTRAKGTLIRGVDFGWGFLGHLDKGGNFEIEQTEVDPGVWRLTDLNLSLKGKMLAFRSLNLRVREHSFDYQRVLDHLSLQDAVKILRHDPVPERH